MPSFYGVLGMLKHYHEINKSPSFGPDIIRGIESGFRYGSFGELKVSFKVVNLHNAFYIPDLLGAYGLANIKVSLDLHHLQFLIYESDGKLKIVISNNAESSGNFKDFDESKLYEDVKSAYGYIYNSVIGPDKEGS